MLGRNLSRRSGSKCELCGDGAPLQVVEVEPVEEEPLEEAALLACDSCRQRLKGTVQDPSTTRFLEGSVWSETAPIKIASILLLRQLSSQDVEWAQECLEGVWIEEEIQEKLDRIK